MCACQGGQTHEEESTKNSTSIAKNSAADAAPKWKTAYLNFIEKEKESYRSYALIYIDGDNIPELYLSGIDEATGDSICTYKNGFVEQQLSRVGGGWFVEKKWKHCQPKRSYGGSLYPRLQT